MTKEEIVIVTVVYLGVFFPKLRVKIRKRESYFNLQAYDCNGYTFNTNLFSYKKDEVENRLIDYLIKIEMFFLKHNNNDIGHLK